MTPTANRMLVGHVAAIRRYPVKSMQGETLERANLGRNGLDSDRRFAVIESETGRVASAKNPRKWPGILELRAELHGEVLVIRTPDGSELRSDRANLDAELTRLLARPVTLRGTPLAAPAIEMTWPDEPGIPNAGSESVEDLPPGGFFDAASIHLLTTATLRRFRELVPGSDFDPRRFRPNILIETVPELSGFAESNWMGRTVVIGDARLQVTAPCPRCIMTTLAQQGLAGDTQILRGAVAHNTGSVGVYANTDRTGEIAAGAPVWLE